MVRCLPSLPPSLPPSLLPSLRLDHVLARAHPPSFPPSLPPSLSFSLLKEAAAAEKEKRETNATPQWEEEGNDEGGEGEELERLCPDAYRTLLDTTREEDVVRDLQVGREGGREGGRT